MASSTVKIVPGAPRWKFTVQAVNAQDQRAVGVLVASGIPTALLTPDGARTLARALKRAADEVDGNSDLPSLPGIGGATIG